MKRLTRFTAVLLTFSMAIAMAGCVNDSKKNNKTDKDESNETTVEETTEAKKTSKETEVTEEATEETTEAEASKETIAIEETEFELPDTFNAMDEYVFEKYREKIEEIHAENPDALFTYADAESYGDDRSSVVSLYATNSKGAIEELNVVNGSVVVMGQAKYTTPTWTYDNIIKFPVLRPAPEAEFIDSVPNGEYFGSMLGFTRDGEYALLCIGDPIRISKEEYEALKPGDRITCVDEDPNFYFDLTVLDGYDGSDSYGMFGDCWFVLTEKGDYILQTSNDCILTYNDHLAIVKIAPDCDIIDHFTIMVEDGDFSNKPEDFLSSAYYHFFAEMERYEEISVFEGGWIVSHGILEPVTINNNTITNVCLSWR